MRFIGFALLFFLPLTAKIHECYQFEDLLNYVEDESLLVVDIDYTLIVSAQQLGSTPWGWANIKRLEKGGKSRREAKEETGKQMKAILSRSKASPCEPTIPATIQRVQDRGVPVLGLTLRVPEWGFATSDQLYTAGIDLKRSCFGEGAYIVSLKPRILFIEGTLFVDDMGDKGGALVTFLKKQQYRPKKVVFIDDRWKNLSSAESALGKMGIPFEGLWYRGAEGKYQAYRQDIADTQQRIFNSLLSDKEAQKLIDSGYYHD